MIKTIWRERRYTYACEWKCWYEPCPVIATTAKTIAVYSEPYGTLKDKSGDFRLKRSDLERDGKYHHSKAGTFWLEKPCLGDLFPTQQLLDTPDFVMQEAAAMGWDTTKPVYDWEEWQGNCWLLATLHKVPLAECVKAWRFGGDSAIDCLMLEYAQRDRLKWDLRLHAEIEARE